jgi:toxin ParE1/3/4
LTLPYHVIFSPEADAQLIDIYQHIAREASPEIAEQFTSAIVDYCEGFVTFPQRGAQRDDLRPGLRTIGFRRRITIAFTVEQHTVNIIGIFYGGQNYENVLKLEEE